MPINTVEVFYLGQILVAILLGGILGVQRERAGKAVGPRTYALVTAGATMVTILAFATGALTIMGQIVTGVGFLGAGMILHRTDNHVEGLTTAAGLWMSATIGMAVGARYFCLAVVTTFVILFVFILNDRRFKGDTAR